MTTNHLDIVQRVYNEHPAEKTVDGAFAFLLRVLAQLPPGERAGLLQKTAGDNIVAYGNTMVSVGRICYPDGSLAKVLTDIPTTNGPSWQDDGAVDPARYIAIRVVAPVEPPPPPPPVDTRSDELLKAVADLRAAVADLKVDMDAQFKALTDRINQVVKDAEKTASGFLPVIGKLFGK